MAKKFYEKNFGTAARVFIVALVLVLSSISVGPVGCKMTESGFEIYSREAASPQISSFSVLSAKELKLECTKPVRLSDFKIDGVSNADFEVKGNDVYLRMPDGTETGEDYVLNGVVYDVSGSSLTFSLSFIGYNEHPAALVLSEVRTEASKSSSSKIENGVFNEEYVELLCVESGNVSGLEIVSGNDGEDKKYVFPSLEVQKGEYITVHFRCRDDVEKKEICIDEVTGDAALSKHRDSCDTAWDLWEENESARIGKTDVIVLRNGFSGALLDAVCYSESEVTKWKDDFISGLAQSAFDAGLWEGGATVGFAASSLGVTATRTISRQDLDSLLESGFAAGSKEKWMVTATSTASPGKPNSNKKYVPK